VLFLENTAMPDAPLPPLALNKIWQGESLCFAAPWTDASSRNHDPLSKLFFLYYSQYSCDQQVSLAAFYETQIYVLRI